MLAGSNDSYHTQYKDVLGRILIWMFERHQMGYARRPPLHPDVTDSYPVRSKGNQAWQLEALFNGSFDVCQDNHCI